jgi:hypothetical protein
VGSFPGPAIVDTFIFTLDFRNPPPPLLGKRRTQAHE